MESFKKTELDASDDRISALPDSLLLYILSLIPFRIVMQTSCLSKRWRHLWKSAPNLDLTTLKIKTTRELIQLIDKVLKYHEGSQVKKFKVQAECDLCPAENVNSWIAFLATHSVEELFLDCTPHILQDEEDQFKSYELPECIFECRSLETLTLKFCKINLPPSVRVAFLKSLHIEYTEMPGEILKDLLCSCPALEDLTLKQCNRWRDLKIYAPSSNLKSLDLHEFYDHSDAELEIFAPHLLSLTITGEPKRSLYCGKNLMSLVYVNLDIESEICPQWEFDEIPFATFIDDFCHVKVLKLSDWCTMSVSLRAIRGLGCKISDSITTLAFKTRFTKSELPGLVYMLKHFVNLKLLIIDVVEYASNDFDYYLVLNNFEEATYWRPDEFSFPGQLQSLKTVNISGLMGSTRIWSRRKSMKPDAILNKQETEFEFVKFLLKNLTALETMTIVPTPILTTLPNMSEIRFKIASRLLGFPRSSRNAKIVLE